MKSYSGRISYRRPSHDNAGPGMWLVTISSFEGLHCFGEVHDGCMAESQIGTIVARTWQDAPLHHPHLRLDRFVVMPNHVHLIVVLTATHPTLQGVQRREQFGKPVPGSLATVIRSFKAASTLAVRRALGKPVRIWHQRFHDSALRSPESLERARRYIADNPQRWHKDPPHPNPVVYQLIEVS